MLEIEFIKKESHEGSYVVVNGIPDLNAFFRIDEYVILYEDKVINELRKSSFDELKYYTSEASWDCKQSETEDIEVRIMLKERYKEVPQFPALRFEFKIDSQKWAKQWSILDFGDELKKYIGELNNSGIEFFQDDDEFLTNGFGIIFYLGSYDSIIGDEVDRCYEILNKIVDEVNYRLKSKIHKDSVLDVYEFPQEIKTYCEQYLMYFTQFLRDLGIEANSNLENESKKVLFIVTPKDKKEGLERIRQALTIYLNLPTAPEIYSYNGNEVAIQQLQANVFHFKSQLALAQSAIQLKDATIESLKITNYQYKNLLDEANKKLNSEEPLFNGIVKVKSYEKFGFKFDLAEILRKLKRSK